MRESSTHLVQVRVVIGDVLDGLLLPLWLLHNLRLWQVGVVENELGPGDLLVVLERLGVVLDGSFFEVLLHLLLRVVLDDGVVKHKLGPGDLLVVFEWLGVILDGGLLHLGGLNRLLLLHNGIVLDEGGLLQGLRLAMGLLSPCSVIWLNNDLLWLLAILATVKYSNVANETTE